MATFEEVCIANGLDYLFRLDELEDEHPTLSNAAGGGNATCFASGAAWPHVHGQASPVETDPSSFAMSGKIGSFTPDPDRRNTFIWFAFGYASDSPTPKTLICRSGQWSISSSNIMGFSSGGDEALARFFINSTTYDLSASIEPNNYYFLAATYNAGVLTLWVNATVGDQITGVTGDMEVGAATEFFMGSSQSIVTNVNLSEGMDEVGIGAAWSEAQIIAAYEAAINATLLTGVSNVIPTSVADGSEDPDPLHYPVRHNWAEDLIERISFKTSISQAISGPEEANQLRPKPRREIEMKQLVRDNSERRSLRAKLWANQHIPWFIPILEDREIISTLSSGASTIPVSTQYKDYEIGSFVQIRQLNEFGEITKSETKEIQSFDADSVEPLTTITNNYSGHVEVCPARRGLIRISSPRGHTAEVEDLTITARLLAQDEKAIPNRITPFTPVDSYKTYEVFKESLWQSNDWSELREYEIERNLVDVDFESGVFGVESDTPGAQEAFSYRIWIKGRALNASFLGWFYERAGSLNYLWVPSMQRDFEPLSIDGSEVTVKDHHYSDSYALAEARRHVVFVYNDASILCREVTGFDLDGDNEILTLDGLAGSLTNLRSLSLLKFCRLDADTLEIAKRTDDVWIYAWRFRELLASPA